MHPISLLFRMVEIDEKKTQKLKIQKPKEICPL